MRSARGRVSLLRRATVARTHGNLFLCAAARPAHEVHIVQMLLLPAVLFPPIRLELPLANFFERLAVLLRLSETVLLQPSVLENLWNLERKPVAASLEVGLAF